MLAPLLFLKMSTQAAWPRFPRAVPYVLHLIILRIGGCHITSIILGAFGWWLLILKAFRIKKSSIDEHVEFIFGLMLLNLLLFLGNQIELMISIMVEQKIPKQVDKLLLPPTYNIRIVWLYISFKLRKKAVQAKERILFLLYHSYHVLIFFKQYQILIYLSLL